MDTKIQSLTDKLYQEGVEKGNIEAERIIAAAKQQEADIISKANEEAQNIINSAKKNADELTKNTQSEIKLYANQALEALKNEITSVITDKVTKDAVSTVVADKDFLQKLMLTIATEWVKRESITISTSQAEDLTKYFEANTSNLLNKGIKIDKINGKPASFSISPENGAYKITFGEEEFEIFFKEFLRPQLAKLLF
ncbi:MAG: hypothetical protein ACRC77_06445 [Bacteroidales bacterium]